MYHEKIEKRTDNGTTNETTQQPQEVKKKQRAVVHYEEINEGLLMGKSLK